MADYRSPAPEVPGGDRHRAAVLELGMNQPGEIAWLASIAQAQVALVNNAQREHQEFLGTVEATARENGAAIAALPADGVAVYPGDDPHAPIWQALADGLVRAAVAAGGRDNITVVVVDNVADAGSPAGRTGPRTGLVQ